MPVCRPPLGEPRLIPSCCSPLDSLGKFSGHGLMPICFPSFGLLGESSGHGLMPICCPRFGEPGLMPSCCSSSDPT